VHRNIIGEEIRFKTITVKVRYEGFETKTKAKTLLHFTDSLSILRNNAQVMLHSLCGSTRIRLIGLRVSSFEKSDATQMTLKV
jgi:DNA polymerase IV (DinB-like DNA polymerase)